MASERCLCCVAIAPVQRTKGLLMNEESTLSGWWVFAGVLLHRRRRPQHHLRHRRDRRLEVLHRKRHLHHQRPPHLGLDHPDPRRARAGRRLLAFVGRRVRPLVRDLHRLPQRDRRRCSRSAPTRSGRWRSSRSRSSSSTSSPRGPEGARQPPSARDRRTCSASRGTGARGASARRRLGRARRRPRRRLGRRSS